MLQKFLKSKIHRASVTGCDLDYEGSILVDSDLLAAAHIHSFESVQIWNVTNGERFETYAIPGPAGSGEVMLNGAAARRVQVKDKIIVATFCWLSEQEAAQHDPVIVLVDGSNKPLPRQSNVREELE